MKNNFIYEGDELFRLEDAALAFVKKEKIDEFNLSTYRFTDSDPYEIINDLVTVSLLGDKKLVILKDPLFLKKTYNNKEVIKAFMDYFKMDNPDTYFIMLADFKVDYTLPLVKLIKEKGEIVVFEDYKGLKLNEWVNEEFKRDGFSISNEALNELILRTEEDGMLLKNEILKLKTYKEDSKKISYEDVSLMVSKNLDDNIFNLLNAFLANDKLTVLKIYNDFMALNEDEMRILNAFSNKLEEILYTKLLMKEGLNKEEIANYFKVKPGRAYYMMENAKNLRDYDLIRLIDKITDLDLNIKSGKLDKKLGLQLFILGV